LKISVPPKIGALPNLVVFFTAPKTSWELRASIGASAFTYA
jgi:hypothetical protein